MIPKDAHLTAASSIANAATMIPLLRGYREDKHADNLEAVLSAVVAIASKELGKEGLMVALKYISGEADDGTGFLASVLARH